MAEEKKSEVVQSATYALRNGFGMALRINAGGKVHRVLFENRTCTLTGSELIDAMDAVLQENVNLAGKIVKMDKAGADAMVRRMLEENRPAAINGAASSTHFNFAKQGLAQEQTVAEKLAAGGNAQGVQQVADELGMQLTEKSK